MKKILTIIAIHLCTGVHSQQIDNPIQYIYRQVLNERQLFILDKHRANLLIDEYSLFRTAPGYFNQQTFLFELPGGEQIQLIAGDIAERGGGYYSWFGKVTGTKEISHYVIAPGGIKGRFYCAKDQYIIIPLGDDTHALINSRAMNQDIKCATTGNAPERDLNNISDSTNTNASQSLTASCDIRLYVGFSMDAANAVSDIHQEILDFIDYFNVANDNSHTSFIVGLARSDLLTNYQETDDVDGSDRFEGLAEFQDPNDGEIDVVHDRRARYDADMCILLTEQSPSDRGGEAFAIDVRNGGGAADAFCYMWIYNDPSTFPHEFGHLMGCEHNPSNASNPPAYSYGHGYIHPSDNWRTIMAYPGPCNDCPHIQHWSNPGIRYFGSLAADPVNGDITGTSATYDNDRVLDNAKSDVYNFQGDVTNKVLTVDEAITDGEFAGVFGTSTIEVDADNFTIEDGGHATFTAENRITFKPGFWSKYGSSVHARLGPCNSTAPQIASNFLSTDIAPVNRTNTSEH